MRINGDLVGLKAEDYRRKIDLLRYEFEILRCLLELDIAGIRKVWKEMSPHLDQPESDWQTLRIMHEARIRMRNISPLQKRYSEHWLRELESKTRIAAAVGIIVKSLSKAGAGRAQDVQAEMSEAVVQAVKDGVDIELEVKETHARMARARQRIIRS